MKKIIFFLSFCFPLFAFTQQRDKKLQKKIEEAIVGFNGDIGIYIKHLRTGKTVAINADSIFPTASIVKVPILIGVMDKIEKGELKYNTGLILSLIHI